jgi:hypothetical protein
MPTLTSPARTLLSSTDLLVFLAGSIEMGRADDWQSRVSAELIAQAPGVWVANPRRPDWDSSWEQSIDNPDFRAQVDWELDHLDRANLALFYFQPGTQSPITLLELGHRLASQGAAQHSIVCCPAGFWRRGNVEIVCARHTANLVGDIDALISAASNWVYSRNGEKLGPISF